MANATVTITNAVGNITTTTTTTTSPQLPDIRPSLSFDFGVLMSNPIYLGLFIFIIFAVVLVIGGFIYMRFREFRWRSGSTLGAKLDAALQDPSVDTIAVILDLTSGRANIVPITHVDNIGFTSDPSFPVAMIIDNPHAMKFTIGSKRLVIAPVVNKVGIEVDPASLTTLGLSRFVLGENERVLLDDTVNPLESIEKLVASLSTRIGSKVGKIRLAPDLFLGFAMDIPNVMKAFLTQSLYLSDLLTGFMEDVNKNIDRIAEQIALKRARMFQLKMSTISKVLIVIGAVILIVMIGLGLYRMLGGG